jgi:hypothetical protein
MVKEEEKFMAEVYVQSFIYLWFKFYNVGSMPDLRCSSLHGSK